MSVEGRGMDRAGRRKTGAVSIRTERGLQGRRASLAHGPCGAVRRSRTREQEDAMDERSTQAGPDLIAELNDLLQLDHDAVQAYTIAIENIETETLRSRLQAFRADHERHIIDLTRLIKEHGGSPMDTAHMPTGRFKQAVQKVGAMDGDKGILLAFKANERQSRDRYHDAAMVPTHPPDVRAVLERNAADEENHYGWVIERLEEMGVGPDTLIGRAEGAFEEAHEKAADMIEDVERKAMAQAERARRAVRDFPNRVRNVAGSGLEATAGVVDRAGHWAESRDGSIGARAGSMAHDLADSLESAARYLRSGDFASMRTDIEQGIRKHPMRAALIAVGTGFVLGRILRR